MNKKVIIGIVCAVVCVIVVALVLVLVLGANSPKKTAKELGKALQSTEKLEKYMLKNIDFKAEAAAQELIMSLFSADFSQEDVKDAESYKNVMTDRFKEIYKDIDQEKIDEAKEDMKESLKEDSASSLTGYVKEGTKFKEAGKLEDSKFLPMFKKMNVTYEQDGKDVEYTLYFYNKKLVTFELKSSADLMESAMDSAFGE